MRNLFDTIWADPWYRYFGRAKDLPGVKELFQRGAIQETEDAARFSSFQKFRDNGDDYYGNLDEVDPELVKEEEEMEVEGTQLGVTYSGPF